MADIHDSARANAVRAAGADVIAFPAQAYTYAHGPRRAVAVIDGHGRIQRYDCEADLHAAVLERQAELIDAATRALAQAEDLARRVAFDAAPVSARFQFILVDYLERGVRLAWPFAKVAIGAGMLAGLAAFTMGAL